LKARDPGRREMPRKVLKDRRSPRRRGRMGTSVRRTHQTITAALDALYIDWNGSPMRPPMLPMLMIRLYGPVIAGTAHRTVRTIPKKLVSI